MRFLALTCAIHLEAARLLVHVFGPGGALLRSGDAYVINSAGEMVALWTLVDAAVSAIAHVPAGLALPVHTVIAEDLGNGLIRVRLRMPAEPRNLLTVTPLKEALAALGKPEPRWTSVAGESLADWSARHDRLARVAVTDAERDASAQELPSALQHLEQAVRHRPAWADAWHRIGLMHGRLGHATEKIRCLEKALELDPSHDEAAKALVLAYLLAGDRAAALRLVLRRGELWLPPVIVDPFPLRGSNCVRPAEHGNVHVAR